MPKSLEELINEYPHAWHDNPHQFFNLVQYIIDMMDHKLWLNNGWGKIFNWEDGRFVWKPKT
jgi:hypothetical protein